MSLGRGFGHVIERYLSAMRAQGLSELTLTNRRSQLGRFAAWLEGEGVIDIGMLRRESIEAYLQALSWTATRHGRPMEVTTRNTRLVGIRAFCRWLFVSEQLAADPSKDVAYARKPDLLPKNIPSPEEMKKVLEVPDPQRLMGFRDRVVLEILYGTAIRLRELCGLDVEDLDLDGRLVLVRHGKGNKGRVVPMGTLLFELCQSYLHEVRPKLLQARRDDFAEPALVLSQYGERLGPQGVGRIIKRTCGVLGMKLTPHTFRHACATHMLRLGANVRHLQELLGHKKIDTTELYTRVTISELQEAHTKFHPRAKVSEPEVRRAPRSPRSGPTGREAE